MPVAQTNLLTILKRFPDHKETIKLQYIESETFKAICDDYHKCVEALRYWNQSGNQDAFQRRQEYKEILQELEKEILQNLNKNKKSDEKGTEERKIDV